MVRLQAFDITVALADLYQDLLPAERRSRPRVEPAPAQPRPCGSSQSMIGPIGTIPVGFTLSWLP